MVETIIALFLLALLGPVILTTLYGFFTEAPLVYSPKRAIEKALKSVGAKPGEKFYDLGAGSGRTMIIAHSKFGLEVFGFELSPLIYFLAKMNLALSGVKKQVIYCRNFHDQNLAEANIIFCFLSPPSMEKLKPKFEKELLKGTRIISYAFRIHGWREHMVFQDDYPGKVYVYIKQ